MKSSVIIDTSPLVALIDKSDYYHNWTIEAWKTISLPLFSCEAVISETCFLLQTIYGGQDAVIGMIEDKIIQIDFNLLQEVTSIRELMQRYQSVPMSFADACLVRMSELTTGSSVLTLDSDFYIYRKNQREMIDLIIPDKI